MGSSVPLIVEVTSTNWEDDYARKLEAYESMGIQEYWIITGGVTTRAKPRERKDLTHLC
jgi:Uma2 family endonuclease